MTPKLEGVGEGSRGEKKGTLVGSNTLERGPAQGKNERNHGRRPRGSGGKTTR